MSIRKHKSHKLSKMKLFKLTFKSVFFDFENSFKETFYLIRL